VHCLRWEIAEDGTNYTTDFDLIYGRVDTQRRDGGAVAPFCSRLLCRSEQARSAPIDSVSVALRPDKLRSAATKVPSD
jgi:hypothetical protein